MHVIDRATNSQRRTIMLAQNTSDIFVSLLASGLIGEKWITIFEKMRWFHIFDRDCDIGGPPVYPFQGILLTTLHSQGVTLG